MQEDLTMKQVAVGLAAVGLASAAASASVTATLSVEPASTTVMAGTPLEINLWLRQITDNDIAPPRSVEGVDLDFGGLSITSSPLRIAAGTDFTADATFLSLLSLPLDAILSDGHTPGFADLSFVAGFVGEQGIPADGRDVRIGSLWVEASAPGLYSVDTDFSATTVMLADVSPVTLNFVAGSFEVTPVPEPVAVTALFGLLSLVASRRRR
jgi:hypothetical protein